MDYKRIAEEYEINGFCKIDNFLTPAEVEDMRLGVEDAMTHMTENVHVHSVYNNPVFEEDEDYYINLGDKVAYFFESESVDSEGNLASESNRKALNKTAYALHWQNPNFKRISFSQKVKDLLRNMNYEDPVIVYSTLIFKHPKIGEIFRPHQDSSLFYTEPPSCIGIWLPLEDATIDNGCLSFLPGSHKGEIHQRYVRCPTNDSYMVMKGKIPPFDDDKYVPVSAKKGDCIIIHGSAIHRSGRNNTDKSRAAYTFHMVEKKEEWSKDNWLQPSESVPFPSIYSN